MGTVTPASITGNNAVTLSGTTLTYTFNAATGAAGTVLSIQITGFTNPLLAGTDNSTITTENGGNAVDVGTASFSFTNTALTSPSWSPSSTVVGAANTTYTYGFTPSSALAGIALTITISVPPGTSGSPTISSTVPGSLLSALNVPALNASGTTLTITGTAVTLALGTAVSIQVAGLTNTYTAGSYVPEIVTSDLGLLIDSGVAPAKTFPGVLVVTAPAALTWNGTLTGRNQTLADTNAADEQVAVDDQTGSGRRLEHQRRRVELQQRQRLLAAGRQRARGHRQRHQRCLTGEADSVLPGVVDLHAAERLVDHLPANDYVSRAVADAGDRLRCLSEHRGRPGHHRRLDRREPVRLVGERPRLRGGRHVHLHHYGLRRIWSMSVKATRS